MLSGKKPLISFVITLYNEETAMSSLEAALRELGGKYAGEYEVEFVLVDDGSKDSTWEKLATFALSDKRVSAVRLSRNFGHQQALTCGYDLARGDVVISMDADLQDPPEVVDLLVEEWKKGADIVFTVRERRHGEGLLKKLTARWFYKIFTFVSRSSAPADSGDFRLMNRRSMKAFLTLRERHRYIRGMVGWMGFKTAIVPYERKPRAAGRSKYTWSRMFSFAMDAIVSFSSFPLRLAYIFSAIASSTVLCYLVYVLLQHFAGGKELVPGWTSLILSIVIFGFFNLLSLGLIGEYVGRIYDMAKDRPLYFVSDMVTDGALRAAEPYPFRVE
ncbi:MAG: glycosyltransferase family 2 protein [Candidatus Omnitrophica bacterium]|nr:glycosyltransferase family 2 protein [Candidatus Omnitrophota bacterium]MDD5488604.1 glycosyltransferase family 2 protein [Candidatus Omnitrophota bacterium]